MSVCGVSTLKLDFEKPELRLNVLKGLRLNHLLDLFCFLSTSDVTEAPSGFINDGKMDLD